MHLIVRSWDCASFSSNKLANQALPLSQHFRTGTISWKLERYCQTPRRRRVKAHTVKAIARRSDEQQPTKLSSSKNKQWVHFIGIGGAGLSSLAFYALRQGWDVSGSDIAWSKKLEDLQTAGAKVYVGHCGSQLRGYGGKQLPDHVVVSSAIPCTNEELVMAQDCSIPIHKRGSWLARVTSSVDLIAVSGSHGKSTTTGMLAVALRDMGLDISAIVGADILQFPGGGSILYGSGSTFVLEADEYDGCFLSLSPHVALVTNVEWEHVDIFADEAAVKDHFKRFCMCLRDGGTLIYCGESDAVKSIVAEWMMPGEGSSGGQQKVVAYGLGKDNVWQALMVEPNERGGSDYLAACNGEIMARVSIQLPGVHNVLNSLAVLVVAAVLAADNCGNLAAQKRAVEAASESLYSFLGVRRRFEFVGSGKGFQIYDDYAHHPTEIRALLGAARQRFGRRPIWLVFQPHTYSRLHKLLDDFAGALAEADRVIVTKVYSAREKNLWGVSGKDLVDLINDVPAVYIPGLDVVCAYLSVELATFQYKEVEDVIIFTVGAGDITGLGSKLLCSLLGSS